MKRFRLLCSPVLSTGLKLELTELPHKMTKELTLEAAFYGQSQSSFSEASAMLNRALGIEINKETMREVTEMGYVRSV